MENNMPDRVQNQQPGFLQSLYDGLVKGDYSKNESPTKVGTQIGAGLIPIVGQMADARDTSAAIMDVQHGRAGGWGNLGFSLLGWVPLAGDIAKSVHKVGVRKTFSAVEDAFNSVTSTWHQLSRYTEEKMGEFSGLFYRPATKLDATDLPDGTLGITNRWGDIEVSGELDGATALSTFDHESVHRFLSPRFKYGQELRSRIGILGYAESHLLRRVEEGLAEGWARWKSEGISGIAKGWRFPYENPYDINPGRVRVERNILIGITSSAAGTGATLGKAIGEDEQ